MATPLLNKTATGRAAQDNSWPLPGRLGFTLLEVMIALSVIAIVMVAVFRMQSQSVAMETAARFYTVAPLLASQTVATMENRPDKDLESGSGNFGPEFSGWSWQTEVTSVECAALGDVAQDLKKIVIHVRFGDDLFDYALTTYRLLRP